MRFTIRDLLWLMVVVGLGLGWWLDHGTVAGYNKSLWAHNIRKDSALFHIRVLLDDPVDKAKAAEEIKKIIEEECEASWKPATLFDP